MKETTTFEISVFTETGRIPKNLGKIPFEPIDGIVITASATFIIEASGSVTFTAVETSTIGFGIVVYGLSDCKVENRSVPSHIQHDLEFEGKLFVGLKLTPSVSLYLVGPITKHKYAKVAELKIPFTIGIEIIASNLENKDSDETKHACTICIDGVINAVFQVDLEYQVFILMSKPENKILAKKPIKITDFYFSNGTWGTGDCPNNLYKVSFYVIGSDGTPIKGVKIDNLTTDKHGYASEFYTVGNQKVSVSKDGYEARNYSFKVTEAGIEKITLYKVDDPEDIKESDDSVHTIYQNDSCGDGIYWNFDTNTSTLTITGSGYMDDYVFVDFYVGSTAPWNMYTDKIKKIVIEEGVKGIGENAFCINRHLRSVTLPSSLEHIGRNAFSECYRLVEVNNLSSLNIFTGSQEYGRVGYYARYIHKTSNTSFVTVDNNGFVIFRNGNSIVLVDYEGTKQISSLPNEINEIGIGALHLNQHIKNLTLHEGITKINFLAFFGSSLENIVLPQSLISIGNRAFRRTKLQSLTIPKNTSYISTDDVGIVSDCGSLTTITVESGNPYYHAEGNCLIETATKTLIAGCKTSIIPNNGSVTAIGEHAFYFCSGLSSITIPATIKYIRERAFAQCTSLKTIIYEGTEAEWNAISKGINWDLFTGDYTIVYATENVIALMSLISDNEIITVTSENETTTDKISDEKSFIQGDLVPGEVYVLMILLGTPNDYIVDTESLIYIIDSTADDNGFTQFTYYTDTEKPYVIAIFGSCNHSTTKWITSTIASCTNDGLNIQKCLKCNEIINHELILSTGHTKENGFCTICGWSDDPNANPNNGFMGEDQILCNHEWQKSEIVDFKMHYICSICSSVQAITIPYTAGDANADGKIELNDVILIKIYLANYDYGTQSSSIGVAPGADANADGTIELADAVLLSLYLANFDYETGSSTVVLGPKV